MIATGMLIQKIDRQVHWVRKPPASGPIAVSPPVIAEEDRHRLSALRDRERADDDADRGGEEERRERALDHAEEDDPRLRDPLVGVSPQNAEAAANPMTPM